MWDKSFISLNFLHDVACLQVWKSTIFCVKKVHHWLDRMLYFSYFVLSSQCTAYSFAALFPILPHWMLPHFFFSINRSSNILYCFNYQFNIFQFSIFSFCAKYLIWHSYQHIKILIQAKAAIFKHDIMWLDNLQRTEQRKVRNKNRPFGLQCPYWICCQAELISTYLPANDPNPIAAHPKKVS